MAFVNLVKASHKTRAQCSISIAATATTIRIGRELVERLGWEDGARVAIMAGTGDDAGVLRIEPHQEGWILGTNGKGTQKSLHSYTVRFGHTHQPSKLLPGMPAKLASTIIHPRIVGNGLQFKMPWLPEPAKVAENPEAYPKDVRTTVLKKPRVKPDSDRVVADPFSIVHA